MENRLVRALAFGAVGAFLGSTMGVAGLGGAVNGAIIFGPIAFLFGLFVPLGGGRAVTQPSVMADMADKKTDEEPVSLPLPGDANSLKDIENSLNQLVPVAGRLLAAVWNVQMKALILTGLMPHFQKRPWALAVVGLLLLAVIFPLGVIFAATGFAAMNLNASSEDQFLVDLKSPAS